jgi:hypothetical protein
MASADRLIFACKEDTAVLTSLRGWLEDEITHIQELCIKAPNYEEVLKLQGAATALRRMRDWFGQQVRVK